MHKLGLKKDDAQWKTLILILEDTAPDPLKEKQMRIIQSLLKGLMFGRLCQNGE